MNQYPPEFRARAVALAEQIGRYPAARRLGIGITTIYRWADPAFAERHNALSRRAKERYRGTCERCGRLTSGSNGPGTAARLCWHCSCGERFLFWTKLRIVDAIRDYADQYGRPPSAMDWNPGMARARFRDDLADRFYEDGCWPLVTTVLDRFGSWNAAIAAAGFEPLPPGHKYADRERVA